MFFRIEWTEVQEHRRGASRLHCTWPTGGDLDSARNSPQDLRRAATSSGRPAAATDRRADGGGGGGRGRERRFCPGRILRRRWTASALSPKLKQQPVGVGISAAARARLVQAGPRTGQGLQARRKPGGSVGL